MVLKSMMNIRRLLSHPLGTQVDPWYLALTAGLLLAIVCLFVQTFGLYRAWAFNIEDNLEQTMPPVISSPRTNAPVWRMMGEPERGGPRFVKYSLVGILHHPQTDNDSSAIVRSPDGQEHVYKPGDKLEDGSLMQAIDKNHIVIDQQGKRVTLDLPRLAREQRQHG